MTSALDERECSAPSPCCFKPGEITLGLVDPKVGVDDVEETILSLSEIKLPRPSP
jgi:hypothetical protein